MVARVNTVAFHGLDVRPVDVQVQISNGLPAFTIVGLPDKAVAESKERVRSALHALGLSLPAKRLTVNLAPADLAKEGSHFDLPIALGLLSAMEVIPQDQLSNYYVLGELSLDATIRAVAGVLPAAMHAGANDNGLICPEACGGEAAWAGGVGILAPRDLLQLINHMKGVQVLSQPEAKTNRSVSSAQGTDLADVRGQESAKRALEIAAAGGHNLLMIGPPGSGKSMLASCLPGLMPALSAREALDVSMIHSLAGTLPDGGLVTQRPFRSPHHSASLPALVGGGHRVKPGEISLAHQGVLFLDELPEFARATLEALRQPLETGQAMIARVNHHAVFPASFQLVAAMNPCRCGHLGDPDLACSKAPRCASEYQSRISGPLMDRIDLQVDVPAVKVEELGNAPTGETSAIVRARVEAARQIQTNRYSEIASENSDVMDSSAVCKINADADGPVLDAAAPLEEDARALLLQAAERAKLSARGYFRIIRVARTIADLQAAASGLSAAPDYLTCAHIAEALAYRRTALG
jgi:magnesium chelatase family protein